MSTLLLPEQNRPQADQDGCRDQQGQEGGMQVGKI
jgi:hypothetical protein